jgi:lipoate-protein ligase A
MWRILDTGTRKAKENMELDALLLKELTPDSSPTLHFYDWEGESGTYGFFIDPSKYLDLEKCHALHFNLARRPTGGGIIFHTCDLAFSVLIPVSFPHFSSNTLDNYYFINQRVKKALKNFFHGSPSLLQKETLPLDEKCRHFCMAKPTVCDVMIGEKKVAGGAQRQRKKRGYLHQGSIAITLPKSSFLQEVLLPETKVYEAMRKTTFALLGEETSPSDLVEARVKLRQLLTQAFTEEQIE